MALLTTLKTKTAEKHLALEAQMDITRHFKTRDDYRHLLERFYTLYAPLEARLAEAVDWQQAGFDFDDRRKTPWLVEDLAHLGAEPQEGLDLAECQTLPQVSGLANAIGCLYVLEGSTLGGQVISRLLQQHLPITLENGGRFFAGYGAKTLPNWRLFGEWAEACSTRDPAIEPLAAAAAQSTFDTFARWFHQPHSSCPTL
ncbi:biliverdin-producing heme oxygenase [Prosthecobacter sp. SYSU 5D2]|uniref:biliverdin-producing heme oxygenase n=1 Tax=Prosthecobacter sp. SYSU 5D2 TaxID=3134134 RepID=UPI0031FEB15E